jgi:NAD(P)-dependent dehydrogenase (short-subunit alcohol dehydrogenase family)
LREAALVTGAGGDIGRAIAIALAGEGRTIVAADIDDAAAKRTSEDVRAIGGEALDFHLDVSDATDVRSVVDAVRTEIGPVTVLVNCAGNLRPTAVVDIPEAEWDSIVNVNLKGTFLCSQAVLAGMTERGWGRIINLSSTAGKNVSTVGGAHYTAAKAGVLGFTRHLASEVAGDGITVNAVCPGLIETQMIHSTISAERMAEYARSFPIPRLGTPDEVAAIVRFLASTDAAYITGASIDINGGDLMV